MPHPALVADYASSDSDSDNSKAPATATAAAVAAAAAAPGATPWPAIADLAALPASTRRRGPAQIALDAGPTAADAAAPRRLAVPTALGDADADADADADDAEAALFAAAGIPLRRARGDGAAADARSISRFLSALPPPRASAPKPGAPPGVPARRDASAVPVVPVAAANTRMRPRRLAPVSAAAPPSASAPPRRLPTAQASADQDFFRLDACHEDAAPAPTSPPAPHSPPPPAAGAVHAASAAYVVPAGLDAAAAPPFGTPQRAPSVLEARPRELAGVDVASLRTIDTRHVMQSTEYAAARREGRVADTTVRSVHASKFRLANAAQARTRNLQDLVRDAKLRQEALEQEQQKLKRPRF
ncbi:hypothetical protein CXG81DRAFT_24350 [Caulochytrium protostelioides]|uniref:Uncharacterized protein n=1 Tax=Caulochytrium protostelioides TaxID=1555241 RepID=A0A4P9XCZ2_9FUNG|nr:hypothetical protein CXG81DRAFT_24350 [Caulochytrium protostelioides]|eukprot:RKP03040.1 hypothetical protein CXG81DRAFT_24350 [Caulochytrium protostelioides]